MEKLEQLFQLHIIDRIECAEKGVLRLTDSLPWYKKFSHNENLLEYQALYVKQWLMSWAVFLYWITWKVSIIENQFLVIQEIGVIDLVIYKNI